MKRKPSMLGRMSLLACLAAAIACGRSPEKAPEAKAAPFPNPPYFGQPVPGTTPARFAPGVVSTDGPIELNGAFSPDGREFFFTRIEGGVDTMYRSVFSDGQWSDPEPLLLYPSRARAVAVDMSVSPDGDELFFLGQYDPSGAPSSSDIWVSRRRGDGDWGEARKVPAPVSTGAEEIYPVVVADGSLYFSSDRAGERSDLWRAQREADGSFAEPKSLGPPISDEAGVGDTCVAPDESFMVLSSRRSPSFGLGDLFVSFRQADGSWSAPVNLGDTVNTTDHEFCPMVTPDGKYLFFSRRVGATWETATGGDVYWVSTEVLDRLRPPA